MKKSKNNNEFIVVNLNKEEKKIYEKTCLHIWGCIPLDIFWAINTNFYIKNSI